jgi:hypothetical protein
MRWIRTLWISGLGDEVGSRSFVLGAPQLNGVFLRECR